MIWERKSCYYSYTEFYSTICNTDEDSIIMRLMNGIGVSIYIYINISLVTSNNSDPTPWRIILDTHFEVLDLVERIEPLMAAELKKLVTILLVDIKKEQRRGNRYKKIRNKYKKKNALTYKKKQLRNYYRQFLLSSSSTK